MSNLDDHWVTMAMADDTLVAQQLLLLSHRRPSLLRYWAHRQRRTLRFPFITSQTALASPTTPLTWTAATSLDGYEGPTRSTAPIHPSESKAADNSETAAAKKRSGKKRNLSDLQRQQKLSMNENKDLKNELAAINLTIEKTTASNENLKKIKLDFMSRGTVETEQAVVEQVQSVGAKCDQLNFASEQTVQDQILEDKSPVCSAARAPSNQEIGGHGQGPPLLLPDLNQTPEEYLTEFLGLGP